MAYRPSRKRKAPPTTPETNITPVMNLVVVLIPMLLAVAQFVSVGLIDYQPPPAEDLQGVESGLTPDGRERLELVVNVLPEGFEVSLFGATSGRNFRVIGLEDGQPDLAALNRELVRIRRDVVGAPLDTVFEVDPATGRSVPTPRFRFPDAEVVNISARGNTSWQLIVSVMDAARSYTDANGRSRPLFALPRLGQIQ